MITLRKFPILLFLLILVACNQQSVPLLPQFSIEQIDDLKVALNAEASSPQEELVSFDWLFSDGFEAEGAFVTHAFERSGSYEVTLTVTNKAGEQAVLSKPIGLLATRPPQFLTDSHEESSFLLDNTTGKALDWQLFVNHDETNPRSGDWFNVSPSKGRIEPNASQEVRLSLKDKLPAGTYSSSLTLEYKGGAQRFTVSALVGEPEGFSLTTEPNFAQLPLTMTPQSGGVVQVRILRPTGFTDPVKLTLLGAPEGLSAVFQPENAGNESTLILQAAQTLTAGDYELSIKGEAAGFSASTKVLLRIINPSAQSRFSLSLSPSELEVQPGSSVSTTLSVQRSSFSTAVALSAKNVPNGVTVAFAQNQVASDTQVTFTVADSTAAGNYTIDLQGNAAGKQSSVSLGLSVRAKTQGTARVLGSVRTANAEIEIPSTTSSVQSTALQSRFETQAQQPAFVPGQLLIKYNDAPQRLSLQAPSDITRLEQKQALVAAAQAQVDFQVLQARPAGQADLIQLVAGQNVLEAAERLRADPSVAYAEPNYYLYTQDLPNDTRLSEQWHLAAAGLPVAWQEETGNKNRVVVAVIDSGFDLTHPDLASRVVGSYDFCSQSGCANSTSDSDASNGQASNVHGTHVAGIVGAIGNNNRGIAGVAYGDELDLLLVKIFDDAGRTATISTFIDGIRWAVGLSVSGVPQNPNPAKIINMSLGAYFDSSAVQDVINQARDKGALLIAATGNDGRSQVMSPAAANNVLGVGSINPQFERSCFSNYGSDASFGVGTVDIVAPGGEGSKGCRSVGVLSTFPEGDYGFLAGTSMAAPMVAGVAALLLNQNPSLSVDALEQKLLSSTHYDASYMTAEQYGTGVLRADLALGLPGPGSSVSITASSASDSAVDTVTLDLYGHANTFELKGLNVAKYNLEALGNGSRFSLSDRASVNLTEGETETRDFVLE